MKKTTKRLLLAALFLGVIGISFGIVSLCSGFRADDFRKAMENGSFQSAGGDLIGHAGVIASDLADHTSDFDETYTGIDSLRLDVGVAECTFYQSEDDTWRIKGYELPSGFTSKQRGGTLKVECKKAFWSFFGVNRGAKLEICIPKDQSLKEARLEIGVGSLSSAGAVLVCDRLDVDCGVGECELLADVRKSADISGGVGSVRLTLIGQEYDFNYDLDCGIGEIEIGEKDYSGLGNDTKLDNGADKNVDIDCGIGSVEVLFEKETETQNEAF